MSAPPITYTQTREISWLSLLDNAELNRSKIETIEYEFTSKGGSSYANSRTHEAGMRVFRGNTSQRGPYQTETSAGSGLTWGGLNITWNGEQLTWGGE